MLDCGVLFVLLLFCVAIFACVCVIVILFTSLLVCVCVCVCVGTSSPFWRAPLLNKGFRRLHYFSFFKIKKYQSSFHHNILFTLLDNALDLLQAS